MASKARCHASTPCGTGRYHGGNVVKSDRWIKKMSLEHGMIKPFAERQVRQGGISYGVSSYGYDLRISDEFKIFTSVAVMNGVPGVGPAGGRRRAWHGPDVRSALGRGAAGGTRPSQGSPPIPPRCRWHSAHKLLHACRESLPD